LATEELYYTINTGQIVDKSSAIGIPDYQNNNVIPNPPVNAPFDNANSARLYVLNKNSQKTGLGITLKVMSGDNLDIYGKSYYFQNNTGGTAVNEAVPILDILTGFLGSPSGAVTAVHGAVTATQLNAITATTTPISSLLTNQTNTNNLTPTKPKAFINYILFDEQFKCVGSGFAPVGDNAVLTDYASVSALHNIAVTKNGFVYIYCSNESPVDVFFDNLQAVQTKGPILEETHYYPFGLTMAGISSKAAGEVENKKKYNGIEFNNDLDLNDYEAELRDLDPQTGRWWQIDPETEDMERWSPYASNYDNPILYKDPRGNEGETCCGGIVDVLADAANKVMISASGVLWGSLHSATGGLFPTDPFSMAPHLSSEERMYFDNSVTVTEEALPFVPVPGRSSESNFVNVPSEVPKGNVKSEPISSELPNSNTKQSNSTAKSLSETKNAVKNPLLQSEMI